MKQKVTSPKNSQKPKLEVDDNGDFSSPILKSVQGYVTKKSFSNFRFGYLAFHSQNYHKLPMKFRKREQLSMVTTSTEQDEENKQLKRNEVPGFFDEISQNIEEEVVKKDPEAEMKKSRIIAYNNMLADQAAQKRNEFYRRKVHAKEPNVKKVDNKASLEMANKQTKTKILGFFQSLDSFYHSNLPNPDKINQDDIKNHYLNLNSDLQRINQRVKIFEDNMVANFFHPERLS